MQSFVPSSTAHKATSVWERTFLYGLAAFLLLLLVSARPVSAQQAGSADPSDKETVRALLQRVEQLEARVAQLEGNRPVAPSTPSATQEQAQGPPQSAPTESAPSPEMNESMETQRMDMKTRMQIRGFGDVTFHGSDLKNDHTAFSLGQLNLFVTSDLSEKFRFLSEIVFEADTKNSVGVDVERLLLQYSKNDYFNLAVGRYHSAIGFYNTAYHHAAWLQTATGRPLLFQFEDNGGILPIHNVGASLSGLIPSGKLGLHYIAEVGNGRASSSVDAEAVQNVVDESNGKAVNFAVFARPDAIRGLQAGFSVYHDGLQPAGQPHIDELIFAGHTVMQKPTFEWLNEAVLIRHAVRGGHTFDTPGFYSQVSKAFGAYRPYVRYQYINESVSEPMFPFIGLQYGPSVGVRYDASESVALKLQYDRTAFRQASSVNGLALQFAFTF